MVRSEGPQGLVGVCRGCDMYAVRLTSARGYLRAAQTVPAKVWSEATPSKTSVPRTAAREPDKLSGSIGSSRLAAPCPCDGAE